MTVAMFNPAAIAVAVASVAAAGLAGVNLGGPDDGPEDIAVGVTTTTDPDVGTFVVLDDPPCTPLDPDELDIDVQPSGVLTFVFPVDDELDVAIPGDGPTTCNEAMVVTSYAAAGPVVDNHDPVIEQVVFQIADLEAAGAAGITVEIALDPCWAGLQVHRDGDTLLWDDVLGDGCVLEVASDFAGTPFPTEIHVVQQTGNIQPPYIFDHVVDDTTVLTGLPDGTWYVKIYEGAHFATTMAVDGGTPQVATIVNGVADGSVVEIAHPDPGPRSIVNLGAAVRR